MDKKKIISSLALAGILTASVLGANVNASAANEYLKPVGVYKKLVEGRTVVPYVLENADSTVTVKDVKSEFKNLELINGIAVTDENAVLKTGDTFKADGTEYTILVYGDVNKDGRVTTRDALLTQQFVLGENADALQNEVADVINDASITTRDALQIQQFILGNSENIINKVPDTEEPEEEDSIYSVSVNDNGFVNTENEGATILKVSLSETFNEAKTLNVNVKGEKEGQTATGSVVIPAHTNYVEGTGIDVSSIDDGKLEIELLDGEEVVAKVSAEKNTVEPNATNILTNRVSTKSATISLEACGESDITKVHYVVVKSTDSEPNEEDLVNEISISGNSISDVNVSNELETKTAYKVFYVLENSYGSKSEMKSVMITSDSEEVEQAEKVEEITVPNLEQVTAAEFSWTGIQGANYIATLYKDGKAVATKTVTNADGTDLTVDFTTDMTEEGTYKIAVYAEATENTTASEVTESEEVKVTKLTAVTGLEFRNEDNKVILSWVNSNDKDSFKEYKIELYTIDEEGKESLSYTVSPAVTSDKNEVEVTSNISNNTIYIAKVSVVALDNQLATINSDETVSSQFYKVGTPSIEGTETSENEVTLTATGININGKTATYKVNVYDVNESGNPEEPQYVFKAAKDVELKDGKIVIDGLDSNSPYVFKLIAVVDGEEVESDYSDLVRTLPELKTLTKVATEEEAEEAGKVYAVDADTIVVAGETIDLANYNNSTKLSNSMKIINALKTGDVVTIEDEKVTLKLDGGASATDEGRDLSSLTGLEEVTLEIESNKFNKNIKTSQVKEVILKGTDSIFTVDGIIAEKVTLTDGVEVVGNREYTINGNSAVIINGAKITTEKETVVEASTDSLKVIVNEEVNNLVFENKKDTNLTINFEGLPNNTSTQAGSIVIKSNGGKVTVTSEKANVSAELTVEVNSGDVDITEPSLTGDKNITVSLAEGESTTINAVAKTEAPVALDNVSVDITDEDLLKEDDVTEDNLAEVKAYIASFGLNGTGATITTGDNNEVTITFTSVEKAVNVAINNIN